MRTAFGGGAVALLRMVRSLRRSVRAVFDAYLSAYPWDVTDEGVESAMDRLHGEIGATGLALWFASAPVIQLRTGGGVSPRMHRSGGGLFYAPRGPQYGAVRCTPLVDKTVQEGDPVEQIGSACQDVGLGLRALVSASCIGGLAEGYPELSCRNAFGAASRRTVCLMNPEVRRYLSALLADVSSRPFVASCALHDVHVAWSEAQTEDIQMAWSPTVVDRALMSMCFCPSCVASAGSSGVDAEAARRCVVSWFDQPDGRSRLDLDAVLAEAPALSSWFAWRIASLGSLLSGLADACPVELLLEVAVSGWRRYQHAGLDCGAGVTIMPTVDTPPDLSSAMSLKAVRRAVHFPASLVMSPQGPELVGTLSGAAEQGVCGAQIDGYGLWSDAATKTVQQAVRFARRSARV